MGYHRDQSSRVQAVVDYYGPTDLLNITLDVTDPPGTTMAYDPPESMVSRLVGFDRSNEGIGVLRRRQDDAAMPIAEKMELIHLANPISHVTADDPPFFIAHGTADTVVPLAQSTHLADALSAANQTPNYVIVPHAGHGLSPDVDDAAIAFLQQVLRDSDP